MGKLFCYHNVFDELDIEYEINWSCENVEAAQHILAFELAINRVDLLYEVHRQTDLPEVS